MREFTAHKVDHSTGERIPAGERRSFWDWAVFDRSGGLVEICASCEEARDLARVLNEHGDRH